MNRNEKGGINKKKICAIITSFPYSMGKTKFQGYLSPSTRLSLIPNSLSASLRLLIEHINPPVVSLLLQTILFY